MAEATRPICPKCSSKQILEVDNKSKILFYGMQGVPIYGKNWKCGNCGHTWEKT
ncbi:MAG: hypothetical protein Kow0069_28470 [Promethearchaeota archaeon]